MRIYIYCLIKLLIFPILLWMILRDFSLSPIMIGVPVIIVGMPVASTSVILCKEYGGNDILASEGVFISTMLSILSIPLIVLILNI